MMVYDILETFKKFYEKNGDRLVLDSYGLKDGLYVKINKDETIEYFQTKTVKKEKIFSDLNDNLNPTIEYWFKQRDYYSSYLNSNKSLFDKKIHNINYLSYYFKVENGDYAKEKIDQHFNVLTHFAKFKDKKDKEVLNKFQNTIDNTERQNDILLKSKLLKITFDKIIQKAQQEEIKNYIKIFFDEDIKTYKQESQIYLSLKIFNDSKYNQKIEDKIFGLSNSNMGLNSKKPFLEHKTRKVHIPFMIKNEDALLLKIFFDWLKTQPYNQTRTLDEEHFFIQKGVNNDEAEIKDFDFIPLKSNEVDKYFKPIHVKNYLNIQDKDGNPIEDYEIRDLSQLEERVDELFYNKQLKFNYYRDNSDIKVSDFLSKELQTILFITKDVMLNYFKKYDDKEFYGVVKKYGVDFIVNHFLHERPFKSQLAMNLKIALQKHYKGENMDITSELQTIREILINEDDYKSLDKEQFLFLSGQWAAYLLSLSKAANKNKTLSLAEQYFKAKSLSKIQSILNSDLERYKHEISLNNKKIKKAVALLKAFDLDEKINDADKDRFLVGFMVKNIFWETSKKEDKENSK